LPWLRWALASKEKVDELANLDDNDDNILTTGDNEVTLDIPVTLTNLVSFFKDMKLKYNDGQGTRDIVTFLGCDFGKAMQTWRSNITSSCKAYVSGVYLNNSLAFCSEMLQG
jgi:hypothetical protein